MIGEIPKAFKIVDIRKLGTQTICGYKKTDVFKILEETIDKSLLEESCYWMAELHASNTADQLWNFIIQFVSNKINIHSPNLPYYMHQRYLTFSSLKKTDHRNSQESRNLFADLICSIALNKKNTTLSQKALSKNMDFSDQNIKKRVISKNLDYIHKFLPPSSPSEVILALNEISTNIISKIPNAIVNCHYWMQWLIYLEKVRKKKFICHVIKPIKDINPKFYYDWVWTLWRVITKRAKYLNNQYQCANIVALYKLYKINFNNSNRNKRFSMVYHAILLLTTNVDYRVPIVPENLTHLKVRACCNINELYRNIINTINANALPPDLQQDEQYVNYLNRNYQDKKLEDIQINFKTPKEKLKVDKPKTKKELEQEAIELMDERTRYLDEIIYKTDQTSAKPIAKYFEERPTKTIQLNRNKPY